MTSSLSTKVGLWYSIIGIRSAATIWVGVMVGGWVVVGDGVSVGAGLVLVAFRLGVFVKVAVVRDSGEELTGVQAPRRMTDKSRGKRVWMNFDDI
jgi:hypothetical protein